MGQTIKVGPARLPIRVSRLGGAIEKVAFTWEWSTTPELKDPSVPFDWRYESPVRLTVIAIEFLRHKWFNIVRDAKSFQKADEFSYFALSSKGRITVPRSSAPQIKALLRKVLNWPES